MIPSARLTEEEQMIERETETITKDEAVSMIYVVVRGMT